MCLAHILERNYVLLSTVLLSYLGPVAAWQVRSVQPVWVYTAATPLWRRGVAELAGKHSTGAAEGIHCLPKWRGLQHPKPLNLICVEHPKITAVSHLPYWVMWVILKEINLIFNFANTHCALTLCNGIALRENGQVMRWLCRFGPWAGVDGPRNISGIGTRVAWGKGGEFCSFALRQGSTDSVVASRVECWVWASCLSAQVPQVALGIEQSVRLIQ
jgi:hypothetical protein